MYSSLQLFALSLHQTVTDQLYRYKSVINWNRDKQEWIVEHSNLFIWKFINFAVVGFGISTCVFVLADAFSNPGKYKIFILFFALLEGMPGITSIITSVIILNKASYSVIAVNELQQLSIQLDGNSLTNLNADTRTKRRFKINKIGFQDNLSIYASGQVDFIGCISILTVVGTTLIPILITPIILVLKLDAPYYLIKEICTRFNSNFYDTTYMILSFRTFIAVCSVAEVCNTVRNVAVLALSTFQNIKLCVLKLFVEKPQPNIWKMLKLVISQINAMTSPLLSAYLSMIFLVEIVCITSSVVAVGRLPWFMHLFFPWIAIQCFVAIMVIFSSLIYIHTASKQLKQRWMFLCTGNGNKLLNLWKVKIQRREVKALQPIGLTYASLGTVTKSTRTDYYYSILNYSISLILTSR